MAEEPKKDELINATRDLLEYLKLKLDVDGRPAVRTVPTLTLAELLNLATIGGWTEGETFDKAAGGINGFGAQILEFSLGGVCKFQLVFTLNSSTDFEIEKRNCVAILLKEDGAALLKEDGGNLLAEGFL